MYPYCYDFCLFFTRRIKHNNPSKQRPMSENTFRFSSLFSAVDPEPSKDEKTGKHDAQWASIGSNLWGTRQDLPSLLQQMSLKDHTDSKGVFSDEMALLPRRRVNLFSSLRLKKKKLSESEEQEAQKEIRTILTNLRNKG